MSMSGNHSSEGTARFTKDKKRFRRFTLKEKSKHKGDLLQFEQGSPQDTDERAIHKAIHRVDVNSSSVVTSKKINYSAIDLVAQISAAELWGARDTEEDRMRFGALELKIAKLAPESCPDVLKNVLKKAEKKIEDKSFEGDSITQGSCASIVLIIGDNVHWANLGDSNILLACITEDNVAHVIRLNSLHNLSNPDELKRITAAGGMVHEGRIKGRLAVSRAIGDTCYDAAGFSHEPEINTVKIIEDARGFSYDPLTKIVIIPIGAKTFIIPACDGLTEQTSLQKIGEVLIKNKTKSLEEIIVAIVMQGLNDGSKDNISGMIALIDPKNLLPRYAILLDGHGGDDVSEFLYQHLEDDLIIEAEAALKSQLRASKSEKKESNTKRGLFGKKGLLIEEKEVSPSVTTDITSTQGKK